MYQIYGAEVFIGTHKNNVYFLTNEVWTKCTQDEYEQQQANNSEYTRHSKYKNFIQKCKFGQAPFLKIEDDLEVKAVLPEGRDYKLMLDKLNNLEKTESIKIISAHVHAKRQRVTLVYSGIGAYTF